MMITIEIRCPYCGEINFLEVEEESYNDWQNGELVQNAFPNLSADKRELLISGICSHCWDAMFGGEEDMDAFNDEDFCDLDMGFDPYEGCYTYDC